MKSYFQKITPRILCCNFKGQGWTLWPNEQAYCWKKVGHIYFFVLLFLGHGLYLFMFSLPFSVQRSVSPTSTRSKVKSHHQIFKMLIQWNIYLKICKTNFTKVKIIFIQYNFFCLYWAQVMSMMTCEKIITVYLPSITHDYCLFYLFNTYTYRLHNH